MTMLVCLTVTCDNYPANLTDEKAEGEKNWLVKLEMYWGQSNAFPVPLNPQGAACLVPWARVAGECVSRVSKSILN